MAKRRFKLTKELGREIAAAIRGGGYPHVAAEACGVPKNTFDNWLRIGNRPNAWEPYRSFALDVRQAFAHARLRAEMEQFENSPKLWLLNGPGRESDQRPGWSVSVKPGVTTTEPYNALRDPELMTIFRAVLAALEPFPEARVAVAAVLAKAGLKFDKVTTGQGDKEKEHGKASV